MISLFKLSQLRFYIPADSIFVILKTSKKFSELLEIRKLNIIEKFAMSNFETNGINCVFIQTVSA